MIKLDVSRILIPVDFSKTSLKAIQHGALIAKISQGELFLLHVKKKEKILDLALALTNKQEGYYESMRLQKKTETLAQKIREEYGIAVSPVLGSGSCPVEIVRIAKNYRIGLIVMGTQGDQSKSSMFFGSNAYKVITKSEIPVISVREDSPKFGYSRILLPIDSSEHCRQKVNSTLQLAKMFGSSIYVFGILGKHEENYRYKMKIILKQIKLMADEKKLLCATGIVRSANPAKRTLSKAEKMKADMIITMTDQTGGSTRFLHNSYDKQLVLGSDTPILSIKPEIHDENIGQTSVGGMW